MYRLTLTSSELNSLSFVASRGYACEVWQAYIHCACERACDGGHCDDDPDCDHDRTIVMPEHRAWAIMDEERENGGHGFGPVCASLESKLYALLDSIV